MVAAAAKSLQSCPTLCDPIDSIPLGSSVSGILQTRTLEWVAISFSSAWKWSRSVVSDSSRPHGLQPTRLLRPWDFLGKSAGGGCHCLLRGRNYLFPNLCLRIASGKIQMKTQILKPSTGRNIANIPHSLMRQWSKCRLQRWIWLVSNPKPSVS